MALPKYNQATSPEQNVLDLLNAQGSPNPPIGQEEFAVLITKAVLNLFAPEGGGLTEAIADGRYLRKALNLSDVNNPEQALSNIGGMPRNEFLLALSSLTAGFIVKRLDGSSASRQLVGGSGIGITNSDGDAGNPVISVGERLSQVNSALLQELWGFVYRNGQVGGESLVGASFGAAPINIAEGLSFEVIENTQCPYAETINVDGDLIIDGLLYSV